MNRGKVFLANCYCILANNPHKRARNLILQWNFYALIKTPSK